MTGRVDRGANTAANRQEFAAHLAAENKRLRLVLAEIKANAESWHGTASAANGHARALRVIAGWCADALREESHV